MAALKVFGKLSLRGSLSNHVTKVSAVYKSTQVPAFDETDVTATDVEITDAKPKPFSEMPGMKGWPIIGALPLLIKRMGDGKTGKDSFFYEMHKKYGPTLRLKSVGNNWTVVAHGREAAAALYRAEGKYPSRSKIFEENMNWIHKKNKWPIGMIFAIGEDWKRIRSATSKQVIPRRVGNLSEPLCGVADNLLAHLKDISSENRIEDIRPAIGKWAFQGTAYFVFGENLNVYDDSDVTQKEFMSAGIKFIHQISRVSPFPIYKFFPTKSYRELVKTIGRMRELGKQVMERKYKELNADIASGTVDENKAVGILEQWMIEGKLDPEDAITQACDLLSAGLDTTNNTSTFMIHELAKQPALQDQIYDEIKSVLGERQNPTWEDFQKMPLVRNCVKETLRLYPAVGVSLRQIGHDTVINGYTVPAGTGVFVTMGVMSRMSEYFEDPEAFKPQRWNKDNEETIKAFSSLPFGFGQRGCYGRRLAEIKMYILVAKLISRYRLSTDKETLKVFQSSALRPNEPVPLTITER